MIYVDSNILVDVLRGYPPAVAFLASVSKTDSVACSQVCEVELLQGAPSRTLRRPVERLLNDLAVVVPTAANFSTAVGNFRKLSLSHGIEFFDCLVAASALRLGVPVQTRNVKHLSAISGLVVQKPYA